MSNLGNKEIMAKNIRRHMDIAGVKPKDVCDVLHIPMPTFSDWINAKTYPRIDKIEMMANYFGIQKSDLVEEYSKKDERPITDKELKFALWGDTSNIDDADPEDVRRYAAFVAERKKKP